MSEGLNLQGASAVVHLDLPTTLRVAEQRVGRVDRMDSPHDAVEVCWPADGKAFATRANELLVQRAAENERLLGSNLHIPDLTGTDSNAHLVDVKERIEEAEAAASEPWDGIRDAFEPVRLLVSGRHPLLAPDQYNRLREGAHRVLARVSPLLSTRPWAFLAVAGNADGAPRWMFLDGPELAVLTSLNPTCSRLREELSADPPGRPLDDDALLLLDKALDIAGRHEFSALPRRMSRALQQMETVLNAWAAAAQLSGDEVGGQNLYRLAGLVRREPNNRAVDPYLVAGRWLALVSPVYDRFQREHRHRPYVVVSDVTPSLKAEPLPTTAVLASFDKLPDLVPLAERITACILGVPAR
jgi:hypothetical protein